MSNLIRFTVIIFVLIAAALLILAVGGVLSSSDFWKNIAKVAELIAILFVASGAVLLVSKK